MTRSSRDTESRTHDMDMRDAHVMDYTGLAVPRAAIRDGYIPRWVNTGIRGMETFNVQEAVMNGFQFVPVDRVPGYNLDPLHRNPLSTQYICNKDLVLMEREIELEERSKRRRNEKNDKLINGLQGVSDDTPTTGIRPIRGF